MDKRHNNVKDGIILGGPNNMVIKKKHGESVLLSLPSYLNFGESLT